MAVKIRLQRQGRKKTAYYYIVVADSRSPRDGRFIERIGSYNPLPRIPQIDVDMDKALDWLHKGALPTKTVRSIFSQKGVLYKKHLLRGIKLGVVTEEEAEKKFADYLKEKAEKLNKQLEKIRTTADKETKSTLERESKVNELRAKQIMERRAKAMEKARAKHHVAEEAEAVAETDADTVAKTDTQAEAQEEKATE